MTSYLLVTLTLVTAQAPGDTAASSLPRVPGEAAKPSSLEQESASAQRRAQSESSDQLGVEPPNDSGAVDPPSLAPARVELPTADPDEAITGDRTSAFIRREALLARREQGAGKRLLLEGLGGVLGVALGSWLPLAYVQLSCPPSGALGICGAFPTPMVPLLGIAVMPFTLFTAGRILGNPGAYGWAVLGSLPGWAVASTTFYFVDRASGGKFNPVAYAAFLLPIIPALILFEWSGGRNAVEQEEEREGGMAILPTGPNGSFGASVFATF